jgi:ectoine hydroxylase-related dioxygenase (phytanoyl-CoA dioxygenase family)
MIDAESIDQFQRDGVVALRGALDAEWLEVLEEVVPSLVEGASESLAKRDEGTPASYSRVGMWRTSEPFARFLFRSAIGNLAATFMRSSAARLYEDLLIYKSTGGDGTTPWHRDAPFWPLSGEQLCTVWMSLDGVGRGAGALRFVSGSQHDDDEQAKARDGLFADRSEIDESRIVTFEAEPGDLVVFHPRLLHTVESTVTTTPRRTVTLRFMGDDIRWRERKAYFHSWMADCGLVTGDPLDHPWFPLVCVHGPDGPSATSSAALATGLP